MLTFKQYHYIKESGDPELISAGWSREKSDNGIGSAGATYTHPNYPDHAIRPVTGGYNHDYKNNTVGSGFGTASDAIHSVKSYKSPFAESLDEARDPRETLRHLETLANHKDTPKHEADAARSAAARIRSAHNIPHEAKSEFHQKDTGQSEESLRADILRKAREARDAVNKNKQKTKSPDGQASDKTWEYRHTTKGGSKATIKKHTTGHYYSQTNTKNENPFHHNSFRSAHEHLSKKGYEPHGFHYV